MIDTTPEFLEYRRQEFIRKILAGEKLTPTEEFRKQSVLEAAERSIYGTRIFTEGGPGTVVASRFNLQEGITSLLDYFVDHDIITKDNRDFLQYVENTFNTRLAIDYMDSELLNVREDGDLLFNDRYYRLTNAIHTDSTM